MILLRRSQCIATTGWLVRRPKLYAYRWTRSNGLAAALELDYNKDISIIWYLYDIAELEVERCDLFELNNRMGGIELPTETETGVND